jgi:hypothetical protein
MNEWKRIKGFDGYFVSEYGEIKSLKRKKPFMMKLKLDKWGYMNVSLSSENKKKTFKVHRLVAESFIPNPENKHQINHKNGIKTDNCSKNLEWTTDSENKKHAWSNGLRTVTEKMRMNRPYSKLNERQVRLIRHLGKIVPRITNEEIGKVFNVTKENINAIFKGLTWKNVII